MPADLITDLRALLARYDRHHAYNDCDGVSPADLATALARAVEALEGFEERAEKAEARLENLVEALRTEALQHNEARRALAESRGEVEAAADRERRAIAHLHPDGESPDGDPESEIEQLALDSRCYASAQGSAAATAEMWLAESRANAITLRTTLATERQARAAAEATAKEDGERWVILLDAHQERAEKAEQALAESRGEVGRLATVMCINCGIPCDQECHAYPHRPEPAPEEG